MQKSPWYLGGRKNKGKEIIIMPNQAKTIYNSVRGDTMCQVYKVAIYPCVDTTGYWATCHMPDGGVNTDGETIQEVESNMFEAMDLYLEDHPEIAEYSLEFEVCHA